MSSVAGPSLSPLSNWGVMATDEDVLLDLATRFSLEDAEEMQRNQKGKGREGAPPTDAELALCLYAEDARRLSMIMSDRAFAESLMEAEYLEETEPPLLVIDEPPNEERDVEPRQAVSSFSWLLPQLSSTESLESWYSWLQSIASTVWTTIDLKGSNNTSIDSPHICVICQDPIQGDKILAPCSHYYDTACVVDLFQATTRDESLFPPRCCRQAIPLEHVKQYLSPTLIETFTEKSNEFNTTRRVYCSNKSCSRFLGPQSATFIFTGRVLTCPASRCATQTCSSCTVRVEGWGIHICRTDPPDEADRAALALGVSLGWARCPGCAQLIELNTGCYHITCRCKMQFCYLCNARWKTCDCRQWDEQRLVTAAEERVDQQIGMAQARLQGPPVAPINPPAQGAHVRRPQEQPRTPSLSAPMAGEENAVLRIPESPSNSLSRGPLSRSLRRPQALKQEKTSIAGPSKLTVKPLSSVSANYTSKSYSPSEKKRRFSMHDLKVSPSYISPSSHESLHSSYTSLSENAKGKLPVSSSHKARIASLDKASSNTRIWSRPPPGPNPTPFLPAQDRKRLKLADRDKLVQQATADLRQNHGCPHARWVCWFGSSKDRRCQLCMGSADSSFLFRCMRCATLACGRCRQNRL